MRERIGGGRRVVVRAGVRVRHSEVQALRESALDAHLQAMVHGSSGVLRDAENSKSQKGPQRVRVDAWVRLNRAGQKLVDIALPLVVKAAPSNVADLHGRAPADIALKGCIPVPGRGDLEHRI